MHGAQDVHEQHAPARAIRRFPTDARSVRDARAFTRDVLRDGGVEGEFTDRAVMIVSELAGNAVSHAGTGYSVRFERTARRVRGEVADGSRRLPVLRPRQARRQGSGGRGLVIVDAAADRWGAERDDNGGKAVWFEIDTLSVDRKDDRGV